MNYPILLRLTITAANIALLLVVFSLTLQGQEEKSDQALFNNASILKIRFTGGIKDLLNDRGEDPDLHAIKLEYEDDQLGTGSLIAEIKSRGNWRRKQANCKYPPWELNFSENTSLSTTPFEGQSQLKMVCPCRDKKYVIREYLVYKLFNLLTDKSFNVRLVEYIMKDTVENKTYDTFYGFLIENEDKLAERIDGEIIKRNGIRPQNLHKASFYLLSVFAYLTGNTDWSIEYRHNVKLVYSNKNNFFAPVPYDFDFTGIVSTPYAKPALELKMRSIKQRRYRGYCIENIDQLNPIFERFQELKSSIYALYDENTLIDDKYRNSTIKFLDQFYEIIDDPEKREKEFLYPCDPRGTGNVIITGMRRN